MESHTGNTISPDEAWRKFDNWKRSARELGLIFYGATGTSLYTMGVIATAQNGKLLLNSPTARASFNLTGATFVYGPVQTWPHWPAPPIVEVIAIQAQLENGDWLALAEGLRPDSLPSRTLSA